MAFRDFLKVQKQGLEGLASVGTIGLHMVSGPLVGLAIGYFLDKWLETSPWCKLIFLFLGIGAGFFNVYLDSKLLIARMDRKKQTAGTETGARTSAETGPGAAAQAAANGAQAGTGQAASADDTAAHGSSETVSDDVSALTLHASLGTPESGQPGQLSDTAQDAASDSRESERKS